MPNKNARHVILLSFRYNSCARGEIECSWLQRYEQLISQLISCGSWTNSHPLMIDGANK